MKSDDSNSTKQLQAAADRGNRTNPSKSSRLFWHLTVLRNTYADAIKFIFASFRAKTLVDYGCGNMPYRAMFPVDKYIGVDFPGNVSADVCLKPDGGIPLDDGCCDIVLSSQVLEHVADVTNYLAESRRILRDDGLLFLSTHGIWRYHPDPCDFWRWTSQGLKVVVQNGGFEILFFRGVMGPESTALQLWQDAVSSRVPRFLKKVFFRYMQWRIRRADLRCPAHVRDADACVYLLVAKKM